MARPDQWDANPWLLNALRVVDLSTVNIAHSLGASDDLANAAAGALLMAKGKGQRPLGARIGDGERSSRRVRHRQRSRGSCRLGFPNIGPGSVANVSSESVSMLCQGAVAASAVKSAISWQPASVEVRKKRRRPPHPFLDWEPKRASENVECREKSQRHSHFYQSVRYAG
jgi:hypothetical protein